MMKVELRNEPQGYTEISLLLDFGPKYKNFITYADPKR